MKQFLMHTSLLVRFAALYALGLVIFLLAWSLSYALLPEGILRGGSAAAKLAGDQAAASLLTEWLKIAALNLMSTSIILVANISASVYGYPLGYLIPLLWFTHYGVLLGTNSFSIPMAHRLTPSLSVLQRSGLYELAAYCLISVSTYSLPRYKASGFFSAKYEKIPPGLRTPLSPGQWAGTAFAILVLFAANLWEAQMVLSK